MTKRRMTEEALEHITLSSAGIQVRELVSVGDIAEVYTSRRGGGAIIVLVKSYLFDLPIGVWEKMPIVEDTAKRPCGLCGIPLSNGDFKNAVMGLDGSPVHLECWQKHQAESEAQS